MLSLSAKDPDSEAKVINGEGSESKDDGMAEEESNADEEDGGKLVNATALQVCTVGVG